MCTPCPIGTRSDDARPQSMSEHCVPCDAGTYDRRIGGLVKRAESVCPECVNFDPQLFEGMGDSWTRCANCSVEVQANMDEWMRGAFAECMDCNPGQFTNRSDLLGTFRNGGVPCKACRPGTYADAPGSAVCKPVQPHGS